MTYHLDLENLKNVIKNSFSCAEVIRNLSLKSGYGANYKTIVRYIKKYNLDISHFTGQSWLKGKQHSHTKCIPLEEILIENSEYNCSHSLKLRLLKANLLPYQCHICAINSWRDSPLSLHLD